MANILIVDDELSMREFLEVLLTNEGHEITTAGSLKEGLAICTRGWPELVFADLRLPDGSGMELLEYITAHTADVQVIMMTAFATTENAVAAMRLGAYDYQLKPFKVDEIRALTAKAIEKLNLVRENRELRTRLESRAGLGRMVFRSPAMIELCDLIGKVAPSKANVLIEGESGTGKELVARAVHDQSPRASEPFVAINCGAIPESLIESELFGHVAGSFTGATRDRLGLFAKANKGSLLLDEVGELPASTQVKLLRALESRSIRQVGADQEHPIDVRILASTNRDLQTMVSAGSFRGDLFYRLNVVRIRIPPLRERPEDIPLLARAFAAQYAQEAGKTITGISELALSALSRYFFPGNVRELENFIERAVAVAQHSRIELDDLPAELKNPVSDLPENILILPDSGIDLTQTLKSIESQLIQTALKRSNGVKTKAAGLLGLSFRSLRYRMQKLNLADEDPEQNTDPKIIA